MTARTLPRLFRPPRSAAVGLACSAVVVAGITLLIYPLKDLDPGVSSGVLYVLGVLFIASFWGLWLGLLTSVMSAAALDYFHASPTGEFFVKETGDAFAIGILLVTEIVASVIADRARSRAEHAERRLQLEEELRRRDAERIRLQEVRASRARVLAAADEERRRLVRDLHDGAQQRLVQTVVTLKLARRAQRRRDTDAEALVSEALEHTEQAMTELRDLVRGILPSALTRGGLQAAVEALTSRTPFPVTADISVSRLPAPIEAAAYFVIAEALTNVVKHSHAGSAEVMASVADHRLRVEVRDNGVGGARPEGSGLRGLEDRLATLDGRLRVESAPGAGTVIAADIPLPR